MIGEKPERLFLPSLNSKKASVRMDDPMNSMGVLLGRGEGSTYRLAVTRAIANAMQKGTFRKGQNINVNIVLG